MAEPLAEIEWALVRLKLSLSRTFNRIDPSPAASLSKVLARMKTLRRILRKHPRWAHGHTLLAVAALEAFSLDQRDAIARHAATIRISAKVVARLAQSANGSTDEQLATTATFLQAMGDFCGKDYESALVTLEQLLIEKKLQQLAPDLLRHGLENAAASALILGEEARAERLLRLIPEGLRSGEGTAGLAYFDQKNLQNEQKSK